MIYEKRLATLPAVERELGRLDGDAGLRLAGIYAGRACIAFVTRFEDTYTVLVHAMSKGGAPGRRLAALEFGSLPELMALMRELAGERVDAHVY
jgi:hypothetical protein